MSIFPKNPNKSEFHFQSYGNTVKFTGNFDSGNLYQVTQLNSQTFTLISALDSYKNQVTSKSFFHFSVSNYPLDKSIKIKILNVKLLARLQKTGKLAQYQPFIKLGNKSEYKKINAQFVKVQQQFDNINVIINMEPKQSIFYIAFALPYSYQKYLNFVRDLPKQSNEYYIRKQVLCYSLQLRLVHLITISSFQRMEDSDIISTNQNNGITFPQRDLNQKQKKFNKPTIIISARVHPGQTPSSYCVQGIIKFLLSKDLRANILRKHFQFLIVPMLNPDGVYHGFYRLDTMANNLNRYYIACDSRQPSIYSLRNLINLYQKQKKLMYFFDLHGHHSFKGSFLYGNAFQDIVYQTQTEIFAKLMSINCQTFDLQSCNFNKNQLKAKDRYDLYTKQGCARVYTYRVSNIIHSYTFELGFHSCNKLNILPKQQNENFVQQNILDHKLLHRQQKIISLQDFSYYKDQYYNEGIALMISVLDSLELNPYTRVLNSEFNSIMQLRKITAKQLYHNLERFRIIQKYITQKVNNINELIEDSFIKQIRERRFLYQNPRFWPSCVKFKNYVPIYRKPSKINNKLLCIIDSVKKSSGDFSGKMEDLDIQDIQEYDEQKYEQNLQTESTPACQIKKSQLNQNEDYQDNEIKKKDIYIQKLKYLESFQNKDQFSPQKKQSQSYSPNRIRMKLRSKYRQKKYTYTQKKQLENASPSSDLINFDDSKMQVHRHMSFNVKVKLQDKKNIEIKIHKSKQISSDKQTILTNQNKHHQQQSNYFDYLRVLQKSKKVISGRIKLIDSDSDRGYSYIESNRLNKIKLPQLQPTKTIQKLNTGYFNERRKSTKQ